MADDSDVNVFADIDTDNVKNNADVKWLMISDVNVFVDIDTEEIECMVIWKW